MEVLKENLTREVPSTLKEKNVQINETRLYESTLAKEVGRKPGKL